MGAAVGSGVLTGVGVSVGTGVDVGALVGDSFGSGVGSDTVVAVGISSLVQATNAIADTTQNPMRMNLKRLSMLMML